MDNETEGLTLILTPAQLAAILSRQPLTEPETLSNRLMGGLKVFGGAFEMATSAALWLTPEPTMLTKVGGVALAMHGSDTISAGVTQMISGRSQKTFTEYGSARLAAAAGASPGTAENVGAAVDLAVPLVVSIAASAARVSAIRATGRISLAEHEGVLGTKTGGHTIAKHVNKTEAELRARLVAEPKLKVASSFPSLDVAERLIYKAVRANQQAIQSWLVVAKPGTTKAFHWVSQTEGVGYGVVRATDQIERLYGLRVVFKAETFQGKLYYILTAFPQP